MKWIIVGSIIVVAIFIFITMMSFLVSNSKREKEMKKILERRNDNK